MRVRPLRADKSQSEKRASRHDGLPLDKPARPCPPYIAFVAAVFSFSVAAGASSVTLLLATTGSGVSLALGLGVATISAMGGGSE